MLFHYGTQYVRAKKKKLLCQSINMSQQIYDLIVEEYPSGIILPVRCGDKTTGDSNDLGGVVTKYGEYVSSSTIPGWITGMYKDYQYTYSSDIAIYCGRMIGQWGHFLLETITRLWFLLEYDNPSFVYVFIVREGTNPPITNNFKQFFELLGISKRLVFLSIPTQYQKVIVPQRSFQYKRFYSVHYARILDRVIDRALQSNIFRLKSDKIFLSRSKFNKARKTEVGLAMLDDYFIRNGYEIICPECISLSELILKIHSAKQCVAESGSVAHNFLFCQNEKETVVMERQTFVNDAQTSIDCVRKLKTKYVDSHLTIFPIYTGAGPFFLYYTSCFKEYTYDMGYLNPSPEYTTSTYLGKCLGNYIEMYKEIYERNLPFKGNEERFSELLNEAYLETCCVMEENGIKLHLENKNCVYVDLDITLKYNGIV